MAQTYTSQWFRVSNGDVTTHNPQSLVPTSKEIQVLSAEVQWEGVSTSTRKSPTNTASTGSVFGSWTGPSYPTIGSGDEFIEQQFTYFVDLGRYTGDDATENGDANITDPHETFSVSGNEASGTRTYTTYEEGAVSFGFPSTSRAYSIEASVTTVYDQINETTSPRVTRDVTGESTATLSDGEQSTWTTLTGLTADSEEFYHDLNGSGEARFRYRFDWERVFPDALSELRIGSRDGSQIHSVALADPADSQLAYNHVRVLVDGQVLAIDVVDPTDSNALEWLRVGTPQGVVCPRVFQTTST